MKKIFLIAVIVIKANTIQAYSMNKRLPPNFMESIVENSLNSILACNYHKICLTRAINHSEEKLSREFLKCAKKVLQECQPDFRTAQIKLATQLFAAAQRKSSRNETVKLAKIAYDIINVEK